MDWARLIGTAIAEYAARSATRGREATGGRCGACGSHDMGRISVTFGCCGRTLCERCADRRITHQDDERIECLCERCGVTNTFFPE